MAKFEALSNKLLIKIEEQLIKLWYRFAPKKILELQERIKAWRQAKKIQFQEAKVRQKERTKAFLISIKKYDYRQKIMGPINQFVAWLKSLTYNQIKEDVRHFFVHYRENLNLFLSKHPPHKLILSTLTVSIVLGFIGFVSWRSSEIMVRIGLREPAHVEDPILVGRPEYHKRETRYAAITNLAMPILIVDVNDVNSLKIDITVQTSNRTTILFIRKHDSIIRDHIFTHIQPFSPIILESEEGKIMIKEKLKIELNRILKDLNASGYIEEVYLADKMAG